MASMLFLNEAVGVDKSQLMVNGHGRTSRMARRLSQASMWIGHRIIARLTWVVKAHRVGT